MNKAKTALGDKNRICSALRKQDRLRVNSVQPEFNVGNFLACLKDQIRVSDSTASEIE